MTVDIEILKLVVAIIGGVFVVWYWNDEKQRLEQFRYVDQAYIQLLEHYFQHPKFGDPALTRDYAQSFRGAESVKYHYFAMTVHTIMETLFDLYKPKIPKRLEKILSWVQKQSDTPIHDEWVHIFKYHTTLHISWLQDNRQLHEPAYVECVLGTKSRAL